MEGIDSNMERKHYIVSASTDIFDRSAIQEVNSKQDILVIL